MPTSSKSNTNTPSATCLFVFLALQGCAADATDPGTDTTPNLEPVSFATTVLPLVNEACNCHQSSPILMAPFSLRPGDAYNNLVTLTSEQVKGRKLVVPGNLNASYLWNKVSGTQAEVGGNGVIMPPGVPLRPDELAIVERWIASGAAP